MINNEIVSDAIEYILLHIGENITLEEVADHFYMSVSYFSRIFKEQTGQSVYAFIKRLKMEQSAMKLKMEAERSITDIGEDYGYSASNYSVAFHQYHKKAPSSFRRGWQQVSEDTRTILQDLNAKIRIETRPKYTVMYERTIGNYKDLEIAWCTFMEKYQNDIDVDTIFFERTFDDPTICNEDQCIFDICMSVKDVSKYKNISVLHAGKYAVYPFCGYLEEIYPINQQLVAIWFPASHYELDNRYAYDQYYKVESDGYMEFDICIPVK